MGDRDPKAIEERRRELVDEERAAQAAFDSISPSTPNPKEIVHRIVHARAERIAFEKRLELDCPTSLRNRRRGQPGKLGPVTPREAFPGYDDPVNIDMEPEEALKVLIDAEGEEEPDEEV